MPPVQPTRHRGTSCQRGRMDPGDACSLYRLGPVLGTTGASPSTGSVEKLQGPPPKACQVEARPVEDALFKTFGDKDQLEFLYTVKSRMPGDGSLFRFAAVRLCKERSGVLGPRRKIHEILTSYVATALTHHTG